MSADPVRFNLNEPPCPLGFKTYAPGNPRILFVEFQNQFPKLIKPPDNHSNE
jgi:hypothetical protein